MEGGPTNAKGSILLASAYDVFKVLGKKKKVWTFGGNPS